jgi:hypothetical protein
MSYTGDLIKIDDKTIPHIVSYKIGRAKLWKDSDRNMSGDVRATLIGIFPKIQLQIGYTTEEQMQSLTELLDKDFFDVQWFDVRTQEMTEKVKYLLNVEEC